MKEKSRVRLSTRQYTDVATDALVAYQNPRVQPCKTENIRVVDSISYGVGGRFNPCSAHKSHANCSASRFGKFSFIGYDGWVLPKHGQPTFDGYAYSGDIGTVVREALPTTDVRAEDEAYAKAHACVQLQSGASAFRPVYNWARDIAELKDTPGLVGSLNATRSLGQWLPEYARRVHTPLSELVLHDGRTLASLYLADRFGVRPTKAAVDKWLGNGGKPFRFGFYPRRTPIRKGQTLRVAWECEDVTLTPEAQELVADNSRVATDVVTQRVDQAGDGFESEAHGINPFYQSGLLSPPHAFPPQSIVKLQGSAGWPPAVNAGWATTSRGGVLFAESPMDIDLVYSAKDQGDDAINEICWELTPFSFLLDWVVDIGRWLDDQNQLYKARMAGFSLQGGTIWHTTRHVTRQWGFRPHCYCETSLQSFSRSSGRYAHATWARRVETKIDSIPLSEEVDFVRDVYGGARNWAPLYIPGKSTYAYKVGPMLALLVQGLTPLTAVKAALYENPFAVLTRMARRAW